MTIKTKWCHPGKVHGKLLITLSTFEQPWNSRRTKILLPKFAGTKAQICTTELKYVMSDQVFLSVYDYHRSQNDHSTSTHGEHEALSYDGSFETDAQR